MIPVSDPVHRGSWDNSTGLDQLTNPSRIPTDPTNIGWQSLVLLWVFIEVSCELFQGFIGRCSHLGGFVSCQSLQSFGDSRIA